MIAELKLMYAALGASNKRRLYMLLLVAALFTLLDFISTVSLMPFITFLLAPEKLGGTLFAHIFSLYGDLHTGRVLLIYGGSLILLQCARMIGSVFVAYRLNSFSYERFKEVAGATFVRFLNFSYEEYAATNPASFWRLINQDCMQYGNIFYYIMQLIIDVSAFACVFALLLWANFTLTLALTALAGLLALFMRPLNRLVAAAGALLASSWEECNRAVNETHGNFKIMRLVGGEEQAVGRFNQAAHGVTRSIAGLMTWQTTPRVAFEGIIIVLFILVACIISYFFNGIDVTSPLFSMYAIAVNKFVPAINRMLYNYQQLNYSLGAIKKGMDELMRHTEIKNMPKRQRVAPLPFNHALTCKDLSFTFAGQRQPLFDHLSLTVYKGERVAIIGKSGAGKSTLIDLLIGLQQPTAGTLHLDDTQLSKELLPRWWRMIGYIPQHIYLSDGTVRDNIVLGRAVDESELIACLKKAKALDFLQTKDGLDTRVGESGFQLSGGQKQRIALARALYGSPSLLILDEGTSALDQETEGQVLEEILALSRDTTVLMVTHRPSILSKCDRVLQIEEGMIHEMGYADMIASVTGNRGTPAAER